MVPPRRDLPSKLSPGVVRENKLGVRLNLHWRPTTGGERRRGLGTHRTARAMVVVLPAMIFRERGEHLSVEELVLEPAVERLAIGVLPRALRRDVERPGPTLGQPATYRLGDEPRAVVAADVSRLAMPLEEALQERYHIPGGHAPLHLEREASPGEAGDHRRDL